MQEGKVNEMQVGKKVLPQLDEKVNRNAKDSVFVDLFKHPEYLLQLYRVFHPEDTITREEDLTIITLESLFLKERYNDLGFLAGNRLMILVEAQSSWSVNILVRFLLYVADTYNRYIEKIDLDLYTSRKVQLPVPELYLIYTGERKNCPEVLSLSKEIFGMENVDASVEVRAKVLHDSKQGDILNQYVSFTRIFDEQVRKLGRTRAAVEKTLRICRERDVLADYLAKEEVAAIMFTFVDKEKQLARYIKEEREDAHSKGMEQGIRQGVEQGIRQGIEQGIKQGEETGTLSSIRNLMSSLEIPAEKAMDLLKIPIEEQKNYLYKL